MVQSSVRLSCSSQRMGVGCSCRDHSSDWASYCSMAAMHARMRWESKLLPSLQANSRRFDQPNQTPLYTPPKA